MEEAQLESFAALADVCYGFGDVSVLGAFFEGGEDVIGTLDDGGGHSCQFGHMNTETMLRTASHELAEEDDFSVDLTH